MGRCETERDGMVLFSDDNHLTRAFSQSLAPVLGQRLAAALYLASSPITPGNH